MTRNSKFPLTAWPRRQTSPYNEGCFTVGDCQGKASRVRALVGILLLLSTVAVALPGIREAGAAPAAHSASGQADRDSWQQPEKVMDAVGIRPGMTVGEVGAGSGYFTFKLSRRVGAEGMIYANDIDRQALESIEKRAKREEIANSNQA